MYNLPKITEKMSGKMKGFMSPNTTPLNNKNCIKRAKIKNSICNGCYSINSMKLYPNADTCFKRNAEILSKDLELIPKINAKYFRFNAHGELSNEKQFINFIRICNANPTTTFSLWTKEKILVHNVLDKIEKPKNLILIHSSLMLNKPEKLPKHYNKVFTVYSKDTKEPINCNKSCMDCLKCYDLNDQTTFIKEIK